MIGNGKQWEKTTMSRSLDTLCSIPYSIRAHACPLWCFQVVTYEMDTRCDLNRNNYIFTVLMIIQYFVILEIIFSCPSTWNRFSPRGKIISLWIHLFFSTHFMSQNFSSIALYFSDGAIAIFSLPKIRCFIMSICIKYREINFFCKTSCMCLHNFYITSTQYNIKMWRLQSQFNDSKRWRSDV